MSALRDIQSDFQQHVLDGSARAETHVIGTDAASAGERLKVYYEAYRLRLIEVLGDDFPGTRALLESHGFDALARAYIDAHPSRHPSVRWFGAHMAEFVGETEPWSAQPELREMALLEWARGQAFDAGDDRPATLDAVAAIPLQDWPRLRCRLQPSSRILRLRYNVPMIWQAVSAGTEMPVVAEAAELVTWVIWRRDLTVYWRSLSDDEAAALKVFAADGDFGETCAALQSWFDDAEVPGRAAALLNQWLVEGLIADISAS